MLYLEDFKHGKKKGVLCGNLLSQEVRRRRAHFKLLDLFADLRGAAHRAMNDTD